MTRNQIIEEVAEFYEIDLSEIEKDEDGNYDIANNYYFVIGGTLGVGGKWLTLESVVDLIEERFNC